MSVINIYHFENYDEAGVSYAHIAFARAGETAEPLDRPLDRLGDRSETVTDNKES